MRRAFIVVWFCGLVAGCYDLDRLRAPADASPSGDLAGQDLTQGGCPAGMIQVPAAAGSYCIDSTEVTNQAYQQFLGGPTGTPIAVCSWNTSLTPEVWPAPAGQENRPVVGVNWCHADQYCRAAQKRLCGRIGGGSLDYSAFGDATIAQWQNACSAGGAHKWPYGDTYQPKACDGMDQLLGRTADVGSFAGCVGGQPGLFDMSGNVWEWEDACLGTAGAADSCRRRGGSFLDGDVYCLWQLTTDTQRMTRSDHIGFRCCKD